MLVFKKKSMLLELMKRKTRVVGIVDHQNNQIQKNDTSNHVNYIFQPYRSTPPDFLMLFRRMKPIMPPDC